MTTRIERRLARRMTHRSRSGVAAGTALAVSALGLWVATEIVLEQIARPSLLVAPRDLVATLNAGGAPVLVGAGVAAVLGVALVALAVSPGRRHRHLLDDDRAVVVADDTVVAGAVRRAAATRVGLPATRVRAAVARRHVALEVTPTSGVRVDRAEAESALRDTLDRLQPRPRLRPAVVVAPRGVVGA